MRKLHRNLLALGLCSVCLTACTRNSTTTTQRQTTITITAKHSSATNSSTQVKTTSRSDGETDMQNFKQKFSTLQTKPTSDLTELPIEYCLFRTDDLASQNQLSAPLILATSDDARAFLVENEGNYDFSKPAHKGTDNNLQDYLKSLGDNFWQEHNIIVIPQKAPSGSDRFEIEKIYQRENKALVVIKHSKPLGQGTADVATWHFLIPVPKEITEVHLK